MNHNNWWNSLSEDDKIWFMMKYGFDTPFGPKRVKADEIIKLYNLEHKDNLPKS